MPTDSLCPSSAVDVAIVGGGVAGLLAGLDLAKTGLQVTLFEAEALVGGRLRSVEIDGQTIDIGAEAFATRGGQVRKLIDELGLGDHVLRPAQFGAWTVGAHLALPLPEAGALGVPATPLSPLSRRALGLGGALRAAIEPYLPKTVGRDAKTFAELVGPRLGKRVLERLVAPVTRGVHSADPEILPVDAVPGFAAAYARTGSLIRASRSLRESVSAAGGAVSGLDGGMTMLVDALRAQFEDAGGRVFTGTPIATLEPGTAGSRVVTDSGEVIRATVVLLAVPETQARRLLGERVRSNDEYETPVEVIALSLDDIRLDSTPRGTGVLAAKGATVTAKALTHVTAKWPHRQAGAGRHIVRLSYGRAGRPPETTDMNDEQAKRLAIRDASGLLGVNIDPASVRGFARARLKNGRPPTANRRFTTPSGVFLAGDWVYGTGLASVVPGTRETAQSIVAYLKRHTRLAPLVSTDTSPDTSPGASPEVKNQRSTLMSEPCPSDAVPSVPRGSGRVYRADGALEAAPGVLRIGTRGSALAVSQTTTVANAIAAATGCDVALVIITTHGDTSRAPLAQLGGTGVFVSALRDALLDGRCDIAVHSLKDLPTGAHPEIVIGAIPARVDPRDALCARDGLTLDTLPEGANVGTGSPRRAAQLLSRRPDLQVHDLRGNVDTRLGRVGADLDAVVLAAAGLERLGRPEVITERFSLDHTPTAPGQGALAIEVRASDLDAEPYATALAALDDADTHACALAERELLAALEAGCAAPIGAHATIHEGVLHLSASVYSVDGTRTLTETAERAWLPGHDEVPIELGREVCAALLAGGAEALAPLRDAK